VWLAMETLGGAGLLLPERRPSATRFASPP
jgi:hypothetical protein